MDPGTHEMHTGCRFRGLKLHHRGVSSVSLKKIHPAKKYVWPVGDAVSKIDTIDTWSNADLADLRATIEARPEAAKRELH